MLLAKNVHKNSWLLCSFVKRNIVLQFSHLNLKLVNNINSLLINTLGEYFLEWFVKINGKSKSIVVNGYYTMLRWGFIPEGGIKFINKVLHSNYESLESAIIDPEFWNRWKLEGKEFIGFFDLSSNSLSWKILNK